MHLKPTRTNQLLSGDDNEMKKKELKLDSLLNIKADESATEDLKSSYLKQKVLMNPNTCVQVHMGEMTITRDLKQTI